jgi:curli biogenesis system outer membrane secretion channel CsgG
MTDAQKIAVLDFEQQGFLGGEKLGRFAADELTSALFLKQKIKVVDRAHVRAKVLERNLSSSILNDDNVRELGLAMSSDFLILGKIIRFNREELGSDEDTPVLLQITFRIISVKDGSVIGIVYRQDQKRGEPEKILSNIIWQMAGEVEIE